MQKRTGGGCATAARCDGDADCAEGVPVFFEFVAQTQSSHLVNIQARVSGFLDKRLYTEGALVNRGGSPFSDGPKPFQVQLEQAKAALAKQEAALETARLNLERTIRLQNRTLFHRRILTIHRPASVGCSRCGGGKGAGG